MAVLWCVTGCSGGGREDDDALVVLLPRDAQEVDPRFVSDAYGHKVSRLLFASLIRIDPNTLEPVPDLAEQVQVVSPTQYRVVLRHGLTFSDRTALDAEDVIATYRSVVDASMATRYASTYRRIARTTQVDAHTVLFELDGPHATFLTDLELPIVRAEDARRHMSLEAGPPPIGAGAYKLTARSPGRIELEQNPRWHGGKPVFAKVRMLVVQDDNVRALRLLAGAADLVLNAIPPQLLPMLTSHGRLDVASAIGVGTTYMGTNTNSGALRDPRVRQAIAHAIDRDALIAAKLGGRAQRARTFIPPGHWAYDDTTRDYDFDARKSRELLAAAGLAPDTTGTRLRLSLRCGADRSRQSIARAVAAMLHDVGIEVELRPMETASLIADLDRGQFDLTMLQVPEVIEPHVLSWFFGSDRIPSQGHEGANRWRYSDPTLDAAFERGRTQVGRAARKAAYAEVQRILAAQLPVIPLWHEDVVAVRSARARAFHVPRDGTFTPLTR